MSKPDTKTCTKCGVEKPLEAFPRDGKKRDGRRSDCKVCHCATVKAIYYRDVEASRAANNERQGRYYKADPDKYRKQATVARAKRAEAHGAYNKAWAAANPDKVRGYKRKWEKANPDKKADAVRNRRVRLAGLESDGHTRREIYERDGGKCKHCHVDLPFAKGAYEIDHIVPIVLDGPDIRSNVQLLCPTCNKVKGAKLEGQVHLPL